MADIMDIHEAIIRLQEAERDNIETWSRRGVKLFPLTQVELCIGLENSEKLVRYPIFDEDGITGALADLKQEAAELGITNPKVNLYAGWREDVDGELGDKIGDEFDCTLN